MISVTREQVPAYLVESTFYVSLSGEDNGKISVPADNFKLTPEVEDVDQLTHLLHTLRYWGVQNFSYPRSLILYLNSVPLEEREKVAQLLKDFEWSSELATWFPAYHALNDVSPTEPRYAGLVTNTNALKSISSFLVSQNETLRASSLAMLTAVASASDDTVRPVSSAASTNLVNQSSFLNDTTPIAYVRDVATLLSRVCKYFDVRDARLVMVLLTRLLTWPDNETVASACHAIGHIAEVSHDHLAIVFKARVAPRLVELVKSDEPAVQSAALRALGALCTGDDSQTQAILNLKVVPLLVTLIRSPSPEVVGDVLWMISNIAGGADDMHIKVLIDAGVLPVLFEVLQNADFASHKELSWILGSLLTGGVTTPKQLQYLVTVGVVLVVCQLMALQPEPAVGELMLECIEGLLRNLRGYDDVPPAIFLTAKAQIVDNGGLAGVQGFLTHDKESVRELAASVVADYFTEN